MSENAPWLELNQFRKIILKFENLPRQLIKMENQVVWDLCKFIRRKYLFFLRNIANRSYEFGLERFLWIHDGCNTGLKLGFNLFLYTGIICFHIKISKALTTRGNLLIFGGWHSFLSNSLCKMTVWCSYLYLFEAFFFTGFGFFTLSFWSFKGWLDLEIY